MCPICKRRPSWKGDRDGRCWEDSNAPGGGKRIEQEQQRASRRPRSEPPIRRYEREYRDWRQHVLETVLPKLEASAVAIALVPQTEADIKMAVEIGMMVLLDKPIIAVVQPGTQIPAKLAKVADRIVEADVTGPPSAETATRIAAAVQELAEQDGPSDA